MDGPEPIRRLASGAPWEPVIGYSRAVAAGPFVFVAGTTGTLDGRVVDVDDLYAQTAQALRNVAAALTGAGAAMTDVVQTRLFLTDVSRWEEAGRAHREAFAGSFPVTAMVGVRALIDPDMLVEVEAVAWVGRAGPGAWVGDRAELGQGAGGGA